MWCSPKVDAEYVARMEDVLDLYAEAPDAKRPVAGCVLPVRDGKIVDAEVYFGWNIPHEAPKGDFVAK